MIFAPPRIRCSDGNRWSLGRCPCSALGRSHQCPGTGTDANARGLDCGSGIRSPPGVVGTHLAASVPGWVSWTQRFGFWKNGSRPPHPGFWIFFARGTDPDHGWSLKSVQRLILTSATWRQSSAPRSDALAMNASSRLLWRFPPRRIERRLRDSILAVSGTLDRTAGGQRPSFGTMWIVETCTTTTSRGFWSGGVPPHSGMRSRVRMSSDGVSGL